MRKNYSMVTLPFVQAEVSSSIRVKEATYEDIQSLTKGIII
jgi:hypothetical protein